jgi:hypothetical protein
LGEPLSLRAYKKWLRTSATPLATTTTFNWRRLRVFIPLKGENESLALVRHRSDRRLTPVRPVFEKLAVGASSTGQTGQARVTPKTLSMILTLHQRDEVAQVRLGGLVSTL